MPGRITPRQASEQARAAARQRLREARETAGLSLRGLAAVMTGHGHRVGFAHLARVESGERSMTRDLVIAWGAATGQADPPAWARQVAEVLGCPAGTVKSLSARALAQLRAPLGEAVAESGSPSRPLEERHDPGGARHG